MTKAEIRLPTKAEIPVLVEIGKALHEESVYSNLPFDEDLVYFFIEDAMTNDKMYIKIAVVNGDIIGGFMGGLNLYCFCDEVYAQDYIVFILPKNRGGFAITKLLKDFEEWAVQHKAKQICLATSSGVKLKRTHDLYSHLGYTVHGAVYKKETK